MGIKVKHEGNATPGAFASESGGEAKRRQQDAAMLASVMQQAANAGNQQLRGASAPGASPGRSNAQLVHAPLMGAPSTPLLPRLGGVSPVRTAQSATKEPPRFRYSQRSETPQEQAAKRAASGLGREDEVVESTERFGQHSPDATWDPTNGGRWVRKWRPGEKEAMALYQKLSVQEPFLNREKDVDMENRIGEYIAKKRADVAALPKDNGYQALRDKLMGTVMETLSKKRSGLPLDDEDVDLQDDLEPILKGSNQEYNPSNANNTSVGVDAPGSASWEEAPERVVSDGNFEF